MSVALSACSINDFVVAGEADIKTGPFGTQLKAAEYVSSGTPVINVRNIGFGSIREEKLEFLDPETTKRLSSHLLEEQDIVFGRKGAVERHVFIQQEQSGWMQGSDCIRLRIKSDRVIPRYLSYYFLTDAHQKYMMANCSHGATMPSLNQDIIQRIALQLPDIDNQKSVVEVLSTYDSLIENNNRRIAILENMAQSLYREWFVNFRFPGHENCKFVDSVLGSVPEGWAYKKLKDVCRLTMGQSPKSEFYNEVGDGMPFHQGVTNFGTRFPADKLYCTADGRIAEEGDILFSVRAPVGRMNIANKKIVIGRGVSAIRHLDGCQAFLWEQLKSQFTKLDMMGNGAIFAAVTKDDMQGIDLLCPDNKILSIASEFLNPLHNEIFNLSKAVINLKEQRDMLLPRLVGGQVELGA